MNPFDLPLKVLRRLPSPLEFPLALKELSDGMRARGQARPESRSRPLPVLVDDSQVSGIQIGEVTGGTAIVWARLPYPANVEVTWSADGEA
ncbi:MAG: hypothetical protein EOO54_26150, partial [Haliea sp.]